jgi:CBS domain-containing protein
MSPKAAWRPAQRPRIGARARSDTPTCGLLERLGDVRDRVTSSGWDECVVVNDERIVLGILDPRPLASGDPDGVVETVMRPGPTTFRPSVMVDELVAHMREHRVDRTLVTTPQGQLIGAVLRADLGDG